jgi:signal peptidase II
MKPRQWGIIGAALFLDRLTKIWAKTWLMPRFDWPVLPFFHLTYVQNTGAAFGVGDHRNNFFTGFSLILVGVLFYLQRAWSKKNRWLEVGSTLVIGGALGNLYDRLAYGYVVDFLDFRVWPVFNVADSCVTVGAIGLAWGFQLADKKRPS